MIPIFAHGRELHSVFDLLGQDENHITYSIGWALSRCPAFTQRLVGHVLPSGGDMGSVEINLQRHDQDGGFTDIEIRSESLHIIVEAKKGWSLPTAAQLERYRPRFKDSTRKSLVAMSECSQEYATPLLPTDVRGVPVCHLRWKDVHGIASAAIAHETTAGKRLLNELLVYLEGVMTMQNLESVSDIKGLIGGPRGAGRAWDHPWPYVQRGQRVGQATVNG